MQCLIPLTVLFLNPLLAGHYDKHEELSCK